MPKPFSGVPAKTGKPIIPSKRYKKTEKRPNFHPKITPINITTNVCIVIGTGQKGILIFADKAKKIVAVKARNNFFTIRSFSDSELVVFSDEDPLILAKSPFLPDNTLVQYKRVSGDKTSSYHRVVYADKEVIDSWINVISLVGFEIATVTCPAIHLVEKLTEKSKKDISILCDIEDFVTSVYILKNN